MKKVVILLMAISLLAGCNNDKGGKKADYREKDDYSENDGKDKDEQSDDKSKKDDNQGDFGDGWSEADKSKLLSECMKGFGDKQDIGKQICPCLLEKVVKRYSSFADADKATEEEGRKLGMECAKELNINTNQGNVTPNNNDGGDYSSGGWSSREVKEFVGGCMREATKSMEELDAQSYCDCMQYKIAKLFPSYADANKLTSADLQTPAMKSMIKSCLPGN